MKFCEIQGAAVFNCRGDLEIALPCPRSARDSRAGFGASPKRTSVRVCVFITDLLSKVGRSDDKGTSSRWRGRNPPPRSRSHCREARARALPGRPHSRF